MFNKETDYALRGLVSFRLQILRNKEPEPPEIERKLEAPQFYTAKILQRLVRAGFLKSLKGKGGGFFFDPDKPDLQLIKLISATEGDKSYSGCGFGLKHCDADNPCPLHEKYAMIRASIN